MTSRVYVDRSRYEQYQRCARSRYLGYHFGGMGIQSARQALPLAVGGSVHVGLAHLLQLAMTYPNQDPSTDMQMVEDAAVAAALRDFATHEHALSAPDAEEAILGDPKYADPALGTNPLNVRNEFDEYLFREQSALVEAMVRAYARRRLRPLLTQFEVLEVEREGEWLLAEYQYPWSDSQKQLTVHEAADATQLWFMSRPDALLRERATNALYLLSYKTTGSWDVRKARDAEHDMQGMSEGIEIERRLAEWWDHIHRTVKAVGEPKDRLKWDYHLGDVAIPNAMCNFLLDLDSPPRILAVRYEYMLKGERWKDRDLSERFGVEMRSQKSHLIRRYEAVSTPQRGTVGYSIGDTCWSWDYVREDGRDGSLAWQNWKSRPVENVKTWIDMLDTAAETMSGEDSTMGLPPRMLGYACDAQAVGVTREHPLDAVFIPPIHVYRNEDELRDMVDQMEAQERRVAEGVATVAAASDADDERHTLNVHFPQTRRACSYPTTCQFVPVCYGGEDIRSHPVESGLYRVRVANHPQEMENKNE